MKKFAGTLILLLLSSTAYAQYPNEGLIYIINATGEPSQTPVAGPARTTLSPANCGKNGSNIIKVLAGEEFSTTWKGYIDDPFQPNQGMVCEINIPRTLNNGNPIPVGTYRFTQAYSYTTCNLGGQTFTPCDGERFLVVEPANFRVTSNPTTRPPRPLAGFIGK